MALKKLIKDQIIIIDDHKRGSREIKDFDKDENDVHIDKETNYSIDGKKQKLKIRIPINSDRQIKIENRNRNIEIPSRLRKEINGALENKKTREAFVTDVLQTLENYQSILSSEEKAETILRRLSQHFDLKWDDDTIARYKDDILLAFTQFYKDDAGKQYFMKIDTDKITIGQNSGYAKKFKKFTP